MDCDRIKHTMQIGQEEWTVLNLCFVELEWTMIMIDKMNIFTRLFVYVISLFSLSVLFRLCFLVIDVTLEAENSKKKRNKIK